MQAPLGPREPSTRSIVRVVVTAALTLFALYLVYRLRTPLALLFISVFVALAVSAPVGYLSRSMRRGLAIAVVYTGIVLVPVGLGVLFVPPGVDAASDLVNRLPQYSEELSEAIESNPTLRDIDQEFGVTENLQEYAEDAAAGSLGDAAVTVADIGTAVVSGFFAVLTVTILSMFMVARGPRWLEAFLRTRPETEALALRRALYGMAEAVSRFIGGALVQALIAGVSAFVVLTALGVPAPLALALIVALLDPIPLIGATIAGVIVGAVTLFADFPLDTILWAAFVIGYQQFENYVLQPRIQSRAVSLDPFVVIIAVLFGGTLFGIIGALVAIPTTAAAQVAVKEFLRYRREGAEQAPEQMQL